MTGCTDKRGYFARIMSFSFGSALTAASVTGLGSGSTAPVVDRDPRLAGAGGRVRIVLADHFADADDLFLIAGVIEEEPVALFHLLEVARAR